jgi:threonine aldolase
VGAVLAASGELIGEAWRYKQMLGGALRQSGILAAGCLYALEHNVDRLAVDHDNARLLGEGLAAIPGVELDPAAVETNIVIFTVEDAPALVQRVAGEVDVIALDARRVRAVTHLDIGRPEIERALDAFRTALQ